MNSKRRFQILSDARGMVGGNSFTVGGNIKNYYARVANRVLTQNGMDAPDYFELLYIILLTASFGSTGERSLVLTPVTSENTEFCDEVRRRLNDYINIQDKLSKLGRIYLTYGSVALKIDNEVNEITGISTKYYDILDEPDMIKRIEYKERLVGYFDARGKAIPSDRVIYVYNKHSNDSDDVIVNITTSNINPKGVPTELSVAESNKKGKKYNKKYDENKNIKSLQCKSVRGVSIFSNAAGMSDVYSSSMADTMNKLDDYRPKTIVTIKSDNKDVTQRNDLFQKVVSSATNVGSVTFIEAPEGVSLDVTQVVESQKDTLESEMDFKLKLASLFSYVSPEILTGEKSPFEDQRTLGIIRDMRSAVLSVVERIIEAEFGNDSMSKIRIRITSSVEREWENKIESLGKSVEIMTSLGDLAALNKKKLKPGALSLLANILQVDFSEILEDMTEEEIKKEIELRKMKDDF